MYVHKWGYFLRCFFNVFIPKTTTYTVCPIALFLVVICVTWLWLVIMISQGKEKYCSVLCVCVCSLLPTPFFDDIKNAHGCWKPFAFFVGWGWGCSIVGEETSCGIGGRWAINTLQRMVFGWRSDMAGKVGRAVFSLSWDSISYFI